MKSWAKSRSWPFFSIQKRTTQMKNFLVGFSWENRPWPKFCPPFDRWFRPRSVFIDLWWHFIKNNTVVGPNDKMVGKKNRAWSIFSWKTRRKTTVDGPSDQMVGKNLVTVNFLIEKSDTEVYPCVTVTLRYVTVKSWENSSVVGLIYRWSGEKKN